MFAYWQRIQTGRWSFRTSADAPIIDKTRKIERVKEIDPAHESLSFADLRKLYAE